MNKNGKFEIRLEVEHKKRARFEQILEEEFVKDRVKNFIDRIEYKHNEV